MNKRVLSIFVMFALVLAIGLGGSIFANTTKITVSKAELLKVADPVIKANQQHYDIKNVDIKDITENSNSDGGKSVEYYVEITGCLKYNYATELPHVRGMMEALNINEIEITTDNLVKKLNSEEFLNSYSDIIKIESKKILQNSNEEKTAVSLSKSDLLEKNSMEIAKYVTQKSINFIEEIENEYIGKNSIFNVGLKVDLDEKNNIIEVEYILVDGYTKDISLVVPQTTLKMSELGQSQVENYLKSASQKILNGEEIQPAKTNDNFVYMRVIARDYVNQYTSRAAQRTCTNESCSNNGGTIRQDVSKYNNNYTWYCCNDCANYVSQAMKAAGVPTNNTWKAGTMAWVNCGSLEDYFVDTTEYWSTSDFATCNAGGIILLKSSSGNPYHAMMTVQNDTVNRAYSAHTNDRLGSTYSSAAALGSNVSFYVFDNVYPEH